MRRSGCLLLLVGVLALPSLSGAASPTTPLFDTFNRTAEDPLTSTTWNAAGGGTNFKTNGTQALAASTSSAETRWKTAMGSNDHEVYLTLVVPPALSGEYGYLVYRGQTSGFTDCYRLVLYHQGSRGVYLYSMISRTPTLLASSDLGGSWKAGDVVWVSIVGGTHTLYVNGYQVWQFIESGTPVVPTGQYIGFGTNPVASTVVVFDNVGGGSVGTPQTFRKARPLSSSSR